MVGNGFEFQMGFKLAALRQFSILTHQLVKKQVKFNIEKQFLYRLTRFT